MIGDAKAQPDAVDVGCAHRGQIDLHHHLPRRRAKALSDADQHAVDLAQPAAALIAIGKKQDSAPIAIFDPAPTPNHMIITGKKMIFGVGPR